MPVDKLPNWAARIAISIIGVLLTIALTVALADRNEIATSVRGHETRITVIERSDYVTKADLLQTEARIVACLTKIQRGDTCD